MVTPPDSGEREPNLPCPHGRASWRHCPHCLGLNAPIPLTPIPPPEHFATVAISLDLAQRILAELEKWADYDEGEAHDLAAELRERLPK